MKLLVLGGSGLLGNALLKRCVDSFDMISTYNNNEISIPNVRSMHISLPQDLSNLTKFIIKENPDVVINTIAHANPDFCESNKEKAYSLHVETTSKISLICSKINSKLIFISSEYVFDGKKGDYSEKDEPNPVNYYGLTKRLAEIQVLESPRNSVLRTSVIYGLDKRVRFLNFVLDNLKDRKEILVYDDIFNSPTLIDDLVEAVVKVSTTDVKGIFHTAGSSCVSKFYFAKIIAKAFNLDEALIKPINIKQAGLSAKRPVNACLNNTFAKKILGVNFSTVEEGITAVLKKSKLV